MWVWFGRGIPVVVMLADFFPHLTRPGLHPNLDRKYDVQAQFPEFGWASFGDLKDFAGLFVQRSVASKRHKKPLQPQSISYSTSPSFDTPPLTLT
jgi:hypothetical protein